MADQCMMLEDKIFASDGVSLRTTLLPLGDRVVIHDAVTFGRSLVVTEHSSVSDAVTLRPTAMVLEDARVADGVSVTGHYRGTAADALVARDRLLMTQTVTVHEALVVAEAVTLVRSDTIAETLTASDAAIVSRHVAFTVGDTLHGSDRAFGRVSKTISDALAVDDGFATRRSFTFGDAMRARDDVIAMGTTTIVVRDAARVSDGVTLLAHRILQAADSLLVEDRAILPGTGAAWTANTDTWAASRYSGFDLNSLLAIDGALFGAGPGGLYVIDGDDDTGAPIDASILTDERAGGPEASLRRGGYLYAPMTTNGDMGVRVYDNQGGQRHAHSYTFEPRRNAALGPMRVKYGRGLKSLMWQFEIFNIGGADFRVAGGLSWVIDAGSRRV